jgi:hypothetical protein
VGRGFSISLQVQHTVQYSIAHDTFFKLQKVVLNAQHFFILNLLLCKNKFLY